jgi:hypothetical protein
MSNSSSRVPEWIVENVGRLLCRIGLHDIEQVAQFSRASYRAECKRPQCAYFESETNYNV